MARSDDRISQATRLSGRYEFSDAHLAATTRTADAGALSPEAIYSAGVEGGQGEMGSEYEVPQKLSTMQVEENEG